jgi:hypothetical protein
MLACTNRSGCRIGHEHEEFAYDAGDGAVCREPISKGYAPPLPLRDHPGDFQARLRPGRQSARMRTSQTSLEATMTEIIEGPITATDRVYAFDKIRELYPRALSPVRRARARLTARPHPTGSSPVTAECTLVLEDGLIVSAGAIGSSVRDAVDELATRLRRRLAVPAPSVRHAHRALRQSRRAAPNQRRRSYASPVEAVAAAPPAHCAKHSEQAGLFAVRNAAEAGVVRARRAHPAPF